MKVTPYPGYPDYLVYGVSSYNDYLEISRWASNNQVELFLITSGEGYIFQVRKNAEWFVLKWQ